MHRSIVTVFKSIAITIILLVVADLFLTTFDVFTVRKEVNDIKKEIVYELKENNSIPDDIGEELDKKLKAIAKRSNTVSQDENAIEWNWRKALVSENNETYEPINADNVKQYGETQKVLIQVTYAPHSILFSTGDNKKGVDARRSEPIKIKVDFPDDAIGLRNLK